MPALNEEQGIKESIGSIPIAQLRRNGFDTEILVVDGFSTDKTVNVAQGLGARVIYSERGYGRQYKTGFKEAKGGILITGDSDGTYPFEEIVKYLEIFESKDLEFLTINRFANINKKAMSLIRKIGNFTLTFFVNLLFSFKIKDSQSGMWLIKKSCWPILRVQSDGMAFSEEIKIEAFQKLKSLEIPGSYKKRLGKTKLSKIKDGINNFFWLFRKKF
jgi:glycosyltransferase involved in cell wall biosynthesis